MRTQVSHHDRFVSKMMKNLKKFDDDLIDIQL